MCAAINGSWAGRQPFRDRRFYFNFRRVTVRFIARVESILMEFEFQNVSASRFVGCCEYGFIVPQFYGRSRSVKGSIFFLDRAIEFKCIKNVYAKCFHDYSLFSNRVHVLVC